MCYPGASTWETKPESSAARLCPTRRGAAGQLDEGHNTRFLSKILLKPTPCSAGVRFRNNRHKRDDGAFLPDRVAAPLAERSTNQLSWRNCKAHPPNFSLCSCEANHRHGQTETNEGQLWIQMQLAHGHHQGSLYINQNPNRKHIAHSNHGSRRV